MKDLFVVSVTAEPGNAMSQESFKLLQKRENKKGFFKRKVKKNKGGREESSKKNWQESGRVRKGNKCVTKNNSGWGGLNKAESQL